MKRHTFLTTILAMALAVGAAAATTDTFLRQSKQHADSLFNAGAYSQALEAYIATMEQAEQAGQQQLYIASIGNIANIYAVTGEYERCEHYLQRGFMAAQRLRDDDLTANFIINSVGLYSIMGNTGRTRQALDELARHPLQDTVKWRFYTIYGRGIVARMEQNYDSAISLNSQALAFAQQHNMGLKYEAAQYGEIGYSHLLRGETQEALQYFRMQLRKADSIDSREHYISACQRMAEAYKQAGHQDSAQFYQALYLVLRDSIMDQRQLSAAKEKLYQYESRRSEEQARRLSEQVSRQWTLLAVLLGVMVVAVAVLLGLRLRSRRKATETDETAISGNSGESEIFSESDSSASSETAKTAGSIEETRPRIYLSDGQVRQLAAEIDAVMHDIGAVSDPDFSLQTLASRVGSNTKYVSYAINQTYGKTFKALLNEVRIEEAMRRLQDADHYGNLTIQGIYQELGYNSAAAFIQAFKKQTGMTPSQFQRQANA